MTRMIERWFPCKEVSEASDKGWGSGNSEKNLFTWFAARPLAQAKAAVICSLLPWPDDPTEQLRLQNLVRSAMTGKDAAHSQLVAELESYYPNLPLTLDPFSGRAMIPLEAARLGVRAWGVDYSPVATLAGRLLADSPLRDWTDEPPLPFDAYGVLPEGKALEDRPRLLADVEFVLDLVGKRYSASMSEFYPVVDGRRPWGYLWATTLPCQNCDRRFPLTGSYVLRHPLVKKNDPGQSYRIEVDQDSGEFWASVHSGPPIDRPSLSKPKGATGKSARCSFCGHAHPHRTHQRMMQDGLGKDQLLVVADIDDDVGKAFRGPTTDELDAIDAAKDELLAEPSFGPGLPAVPDEPVPPGNGRSIGPLVYGFGRYGDFCNNRQTLGFVRLSRTIDQLAGEMLAGGVSPEYVAALAGYSGAVLVRKLKRSTRGCQMSPRKDIRSNRIDSGHIFANEASITFSYDYFETGVGLGPGTWPSLIKDTIASLRSQLARPTGRPANITRGTALSVPLGDNKVDAVVTDPPYDEMVPYSDISDLFYVWLKRALVTSHPEMVMTGDPRGLQDKAEEIIVKRTTKAEKNEHRTREFYDAKIAEAFVEAHRVVNADGVVTVVFGHGDPGVWHRLLGAIDHAGLVLTGSWPARTESGGKAGSANIETTLTLACRPAPPGRKDGRVAKVDAEVRQEIRDRMPLWEAAGLALSDQLMASAGPAMEIVGRYSSVMNKRGEPVALDRYLPLARKFVEEAADIRIDSLPLGTFDDRSRFGLFWARANGRNVMPGSEARWQRLASDLTDEGTEGILVKVSKGVRLAYGHEHESVITPTSSVIDIALSMAATGKTLADAAQLLVESDRINDDFLWACIGELSRAVPDADEDGEVWTWLIRNREQVVSATRNVQAVRAQEQEDSAPSLFNRTLFDADVVGGD